MNKRKFGCFKTSMLLTWVFWYLILLSTLHNSEGWRPRLAAKCMCGLAFDITDLHSIVLPEPDSPTIRTGSWTSRSISRRYACFSYCIGARSTVQFIHLLNEENIILMLICTLWNKRQTWGTDVKKSCGLLRMLQLMKLVVSLISSLNSKKCSNTVPSGEVSTLQWLIYRASRTKISKCGQCLQWEQAYSFTYIIATSRI